MPASAPTPITPDQNETQRLVEATKSLPADIHTSTATSDDSQHLVQHPQLFPTHVPTTASQTTSFVDLGGPPASIFHQAPPTLVLGLAEIVPRATIDKEAQTHGHAYTLMPKILGSTSLASTIPNTHHAGTLSLAEHVIDAPPSIEQPPTESQNISSNAAENNRAVKDVSRTNGEQITSVWSIEQATAGPQTDGIIAAKNTRPTKEITHSYVDQIPNPSLSINLGTKPMANGISATKDTWPTKGPVQTQALFGQAEQLTKDFVPQTAQSPQADNTLTSVSAPGKSLLTLFSEAPASLDQGKTTHVQDPALGSEVHPQGASCIVPPDAKVAQPSNTRQDTQPNTAKCNSSNTPPAWIHLPAQLISVADDVAHSARGPVQEPPRRKRAASGDEEDSAGVKGREQSKRRGIKRRNIDLGRSIPSTSSKQDDVSTAASKKAAAPASKADGNENDQSKDAPELPPIKQPKPGCQAVIGHAAGEKKSAPDPAKDERAKGYKSSDWETDGDALDTSSRSTAKARRSGKGSMRSKASSSKTKASQKSGVRKRAPKEGPRVGMKGLRSTNKRPARQRPAARNSSIDGYEADLDDGPVSSRRSGSSRKNAKGRPSKAKTAPELDQPFFDYSGDLERIAEA